MTDFEEDNTDELIEPFINDSWDMVIFTSAIFCLVCLLLPLLLLLEEIQKFCHRRKLNSQVGPSPNDAEYRDSIQSFRRELKEGSDLDLLQTQVSESESQGIQSLDNYGLDTKPLDHRKEKEQVPVLLLDKVLEEFLDFMEGQLPAASLPKGKVVLVDESIETESEQKILETPPENTKIHLQKRQILKPPPTSPLPKEKVLLVDESIDTGSRQKNLGVTPLQVTKIQPMKRRILMKNKQIQTDRTSSDENLLEECGGVP